MGNQQSVAQVKNEVVNKSIANVLMQSSQECAQNNSSIQTMNISGIQNDCGGVKISGVNQKSVQAPNFSCSNDTQNSADLMNKLKSQLEANATNELSGVPGALNSQQITDTKNTIINDIQKNINISSVSKCVQDNVASQAMNLTNYIVKCPKCCDLGTCKDEARTCNRDININDISQDITQSAVASCYQASDNKVTDLVESLQQAESKSESKSTGFLNITDMSKNAGMMIVISILICVLPLLLSISSSLAFSLSSGGQEMAKSAGASLPELMKGAGGMAKFI